MDYATARATLLAPGRSGVVLEIGWADREADETARMVLGAFADGSAHAALSSGLVLSGHHPAAADALLDAALAQIAALTPAAPASPSAGDVVITVLAEDGTCSTTAREEQLGIGALALSPVFMAAHVVFRELRLAFLDAHGAEHEQVRELYGAPRWSLRQLAAAADDAAMFALLRDRDVEHATGAFEGGNDEGGMQDLVLHAGGIRRTLDWNVEDPGDKRIYECLEERIYDEIGFAGDFEIEGTVAWDVAAGTLTLRQRCVGEDDEMFEPGDAG